MEEIGKLLSGENVCRTCLCTSEDMSSIFVQLEDSVTLRDMLTSFCSIQIKEEDNINMICNDCSKETLQAFKFKLKCERSDNILKVQYQNNSSKLHQTPSTEFPLKDEMLEDNNECIKYEVDSDYIPFDDIQIKSEADDSDKDEKLSLAAQFGLTRTQHRKKKKLKTTNTEKKASSKKVKIKEKIKGNSDTILKKTHVQNGVDNNGYKKIYECPKCYAFFKTYHMIGKHMGKVHQTFIKSERQYDEIRREAAKSKVQVFKAVRGGTEQESPQEMDEKDGNGLYRCTVCDFTSKSFETMKPHIINHRGEKYISCDECDYRCSDVRRLASHKLGHLESRPYPCTECPYSAQSRTLLGYHVASRHRDEKPFSCHICNYTTKLKISLSQHIARRHEKRKDHECKVCGKRFFSSYHQKLHSMTHGGDKPHVCEHCAMRFIQKSNLLKHVSVMHRDTGSRPFACAQCPYRSRTRQTLRKHVMRHTGERPHACPKCRFTCIAKSTLDLHVLRHKGEKQHACATCDYRCYSLDRLRAHERVHTGERPYPCEICSYRAKTRARLKNHIKSHQNDQKFSCQHCPYRANYRSNLLYHIKRGCHKIGRRYGTTQNPAVPHTVAEEPAEGSTPQLAVASGILKVELLTTDNAEFPSDNN